MKSVATLLCLLFMTACAPSLSDYAAEKPTIQPDAFFNGKMSSWGIFEDWHGKVISRFRMDATAHWQGDTGKMDEYFTYADGTTRERHWTLHKTDNAHFSGTAPDVTGDAKGEISGNTLHWNYVITLPRKSGPITVRFDDWLYLVDQDHLFSRVAVSKYGLPVGEMTMFFSKTDLK